MMPKDKTLNQQLIDHVDMLYKMVANINVKINLDNKAVKSNASKLSKRIDKLEKED